MNKFNMNGKLIHKASDHNTKRCEVEKWVFLPHSDFERLKANPYQEHEAITAARDLMYEDKNAYHCIMLLDEYGEDGLLIEAEGFDYPRLSMFVPDAKSIYERYQTSESELKLHDMIKDTVEKIAELAHTDKTDFTAADMIDMDEVESLIKNAIVQQLAQRDDISISVALDVTEDVIKGNVSIIKHSDDEEDNVENLETGAEFEVYLKCAGSYDKAKDSERDRLITDKNGFAKTKDMPYGTYTVHQTKTVNDAAFVADFDVTITKEGQPYEYILNNKPFRSYIHITKVDAETGKVIPYEGAGFQIYDSDGNLVDLGTDTFYTNKDGCLITPDSLKYGDYTLVEVQAPVGYVLDSTPVPFTVNAENADEENEVNIVKIIKADTAQKGRISVSKRGEVFKSVAVSSSAYGNEDGKYIESPTIYTPVFEVSGLSGAEFEVIAAEEIYTADGTLRASAGEVVADIITDNKGNAATEPLYLGKYAVKEKKAPYGYVLNSEAKEVELTYGLWLLILLGNNI